MPDLITMDGQYAHARDPYTQVRILCVDGQGAYPVVVLDNRGDLARHKAMLPDQPRGYDLVPLQHRRKPVEAWAVADKHNDLVCADVDRDYCETILKPGLRLVRLIEAEDAP